MQMAVANGATDKALAIKAAASDQAPPIAEPAAEFPTGAGEDSSDAERTRATGPLS